MEDSLDKGFCAGFQSEINDNMWEKFTNGFFAQRKSRFFLIDICYIVNKLGIYSTTVLDMSLFCGIILYILLFK